MRKIVKARDDLRQNGDKAGIKALLRPIDTLSLIDCMWQYGAPSEETDLPYDKTES